MQLRFDLSVASFIEEKVWFKGQDIVKAPDKYLLFSFGASGLFSRYNFILHQGSSVEVLEPLFVRDKMIDIYKRALNQYEM